jgi:hypothetical protein
MRAFIERRLNPQYIRLVCGMVLAMFVIVSTISLVTSVRGRTVFGPQLGADFGAFYIGGKIFNEHGANQIYDANLHHRLYRAMFPQVPDDSRVPYVNAPFFILPFVLLSRLPYTLAYLLWVFISVALFLGALRLLRTALPHISEHDWRTAILMSVSFMPFLVECLAGGQTTAVGFFCFSLALACERWDRRLLSGLALSLCAYKPTLLILTIPMLLLTRRWLTIAGVAMGSAGLGLISLLTVGRDGCLAFIQRLLSFANASTAVEITYRSWKYVDVNTFFRALLGGQPYLRWFLTAAVFVVGLSFLFRIWWRAPSDSDTQKIVWALVLTWTLVLNIYLGIYDSTLVVIGALLLLDPLYRNRDLERPVFSSRLKFMLLLLYLTPWVTQPIARLTNVQIYTIVLAGFGVYLIKQQRLSHRQ